jgi:hypothetical protein
MLIPYFSAYQESSSNNQPIRNNLSSCEQATGSNATRAAQLICCFKHLNEKVVTRGG